MSTERISGISDRTVDSVNSALKKGLMRSFVLRGPITEEINQHYLASVRNIFEIDSLAFRVIIKNERLFSKAEFYNKMGAIFLPSHLENEDSSVSNQMEFVINSKILAIKNTPSVLLRIGESNNTEQEMAILYVASGLSAKSAVKWLQRLSQDSSKKRWNSFSI